MHIDDRIPFGFRHREQHAVTQNSGVVDHDVEIAKGLDCGVDQSFSSGPIAHAVAVSNCLTAHTFDFLHNLFSGTQVAATSVNVSTEVVDHDFGTLRCQAQRVLAPNSTTGSGHNGDFSFT